MTRPAPATEPDHRHRPPLHHSTGLNFDPFEFLDLADHLASMDGYPSRTTHLRRAVSTAYYALFHELVAEVVIVAVEPAVWDVPAAKVARWLSHTDLASLCRAATGTGGRALRDALEPVTPETAVVARAFLDLQAERHQADYDDAYDIVPGQAVALVATAREAVMTAQQLLQQDNSDHRRFLSMGLGAVRVAKDRG